MCIFYCLLRKKRCTLLPDGTDVRIQQHIHQKDLNLCLPLYQYGKVIVELEKAQTRNSTGLIVLVIWPSSTFKLPFVFGFNKWCYSSNNFFLLSFKNSWVVVVWLLIFDMVKQELRVASYKLRVESLKARVGGLKARVKIQKYEMKSNPQVASSNPRITSSNPRVRSSNSRVRESLSQRKLK